MLCLRRGRSADALESSREAAGIWRALTAVSGDQDENEQDRDRYLAGLAVASTNVNGALSQLGMEEAVDLQRRLAAADPDGY